MQHKVNYLEQYKTSDLKQIKARDLEKLKPRNMEQLKASDLEQPKASSTFVADSEEFVKFETRDVTTDTLLIPAAARISRYSLVVDEGIMVVTVEKQVRKLMKFTDLLA